MTIATTTARILLGLIFAAAGISGFLIINNPPPAPPGMAADFQHVFFASRWVLFVDGIEALAGILLLANQYVPFALTLVAALLWNIFAFHVTMAQASLPIPIIVLALWVLASLPYRSHIAPLFARRITA